MTTIETNHNQAPIESDPNIGGLVPADIAGVALGESVARPNRTVTFGGTEFETNLPEGVDLFVDNGASDLSQVIRPTELDKLPVGDFFVSGTVEESDEFFRKVPVEKNREVHITQTHQGKAIESGAFSSPWEIGHGMADVMTSLGYVVDDSHPDYPQVIGIPTPESLKKGAHDLGVDVEFFPDESGKIPGKKYLEAFARGSYPLSTSNESDYRHDSEDDHLTAMVFGGAPLRDALKEVSSKALSENQATIDSTALGLDVYTATLRAVVSWHPGLLGEAYGKESGRRTLIESGDRIGLSSEQSMAILAAAQENARKLGIEPKELD